MASNNKFFNQLREIYGNDVVSTYKKFADTNRKLNTQLHRKIFLIKCRKYNVFPAHISNCTNNIYYLLNTEHPFKKDIDRATYRYKKNIINIEIKITFYTINKLRDELEKYRIAITNTSATIFHKVYFEFQTSFVKRLTSKCEKNYEQKFERIIQRQMPSNKPSFNESHVINLTSVIIPPETKMIMSYGPKFAMNVKNMSTNQIFRNIADIESILSTTPDETLRSQVRSEIVNTITNYLNRPNNRKSITDKYLTQCYHSAKRFFNENQQLISLQADKGNKTVIMKRDDYLEKMNALVSDNNTYTKMRNNPTARVKRRNNELALRWSQNKYIDVKERAYINTSSAWPPRIYGLPKIHKPNIPLRPIVSSINAPTYNMSKFLANIIRKSINHEKYNILNSYTFHDFIVKQKIPQNYILVSLDVVSLFTNIPMDIVKENIDKRWNEIRKYTSLPLSDFHDGIDLTLSHNYFMWESNFYLQKTGTPMGSCLSPSIADLVMDILLDTVIQKLPFEVPFVKKYVDDLITAIPIGSEEQILRDFNSYHPQLQFTIESEVDNLLPFLDMVLIRNAENGSITTRWYRKPTSSGRLLNFLSGHNINQKLNTATGFINRVYSLTSDPNFDSKSTIKKLLQSNNYPKSVINTLITKYLKRKENENNAILQSPDTPVMLYKSLPFCGPITYSLARVIKSYFPHIRLGYRCPDTLSKIFSRLKDKIEPLEQANVVYSIPCGGCEKCYVGLTTTAMKVRLSNHKSNKRRLDGMTGQEVEFFRDPLVAQNEDQPRFSNKTALIKHTMETEHIFKYDDFKILTTENNLEKLKILEMLHINNENTVNIKTDVDGLNIQYINILNKLKQPRL